MERETFNYRKSGISPYTVLSYALFAISLLLALFGLRNPGGAGFTVNGRPATPEEAQHFVATAFVVSAVAGVTGVLLVLYWVKCRVDIINGRISWFNFWGKCVVDGSLESAQFVPLGRYDADNRRTITTDGGEIRVSTSLDRFGVLWAKVQKTDVYAADSSERPLESVFACRSQSIRIGPEGIEDRDRHGNLRIAARWNQVVTCSLENLGSGVQTCVIHTTVGTVRSSFSTPKPDKLYHEIRAVIDGRPQAAPVSQPT